MKHTSMKQQLINRVDNKSNTYDYSDNYGLTVSYTSDKTGTFKINFHTEIVNMEQLTMGIDALEIAEKGDRVVISLQSCGGNVDAAGGFIQAMHNCRAPIHVIASGGIHSAATHILLEANSFELARNFNSLIHNGSMGVGGNLNEVFPMAKFNEKFLYSYYKDIYTGFLSDAEFESMWNGAQIWLDADGWMERTENREAFFEAEMEKFNKAAEKLLQENDVPAEEIPKIIAARLPAKKAPQKTVPAKAAPKRKGK